MLVLRLLDRRWSRAYGLWHLWLMAPIVALRMRCDSRWQSIVSSECRRRPTPSVAIRHDAILLRVDGGLVLAYPNPTLPSVDAQTSRSWIQNIYRLSGEMASDNPGSDLAWHDQWVMTSIMASSYFLYVCAIVTAQGLRHRFSLNKTEEGSPRRHSKFLNLFSVVRWEAVINKRISQKMCIA